MGLGSGGQDHRPAGLQDAVSCALQSPQLGICAGSQGDPAPEGGGDVALPPSGVALSFPPQPTSSRTTSTHARRPSMALA
jgi:hypothetical protein